MPNPRCQNFLSFFGELWHTEGGRKSPGRQDPDNALPVMVAWTMRLEVLRELHLAQLHLRLTAPITPKKGP